MSEEPVFERIGNLLLERLREEMVPAVLNQGLAGFRRWAEMQTLIVSRQGDAGQK